MAVALVACGALVAPPIIDPFTPIGAGLLILAAVAHPAPARAGWLPTAVGALSYSFYLWHAYFLGEHGLSAWWGGIVAALVVTVLVSTVVYLSVERPGIELGRRLSRRLRSRAVTRPVREPAG